MVGLVSFVKWRSNWSTLIWYKSWNHRLYRNVSDFVSERCHFCSSLPKTREQTGSRFLEGMPRVTRSTPTPAPPAEAVPTVGAAPVSASPLDKPDPHPSRALLCTWGRRLHSRTYRASRQDPWGRAWSSTSSAFSWRLASPPLSGPGMRSPARRAGSPRRCRLARGQRHGPWS